MYDMLTGAVSATSVCSDVFFFRGLYFKTLEMNLLQLAHAKPEALSGSTIVQYS